MPHLITRLAHLRSAAIQVGTTRYAIDDSGVADVSDEHAEELLGHAGSAWTIHDPQAATLASLGVRKRQPLKALFTPTRSAQADVLPEDLDQAPASAQGNRVAPQPPPGDSAPQNLVVPAAAPPSQTPVTPATTPVTYAAADLQADGDMTNAGITDETPTDDAVDTLPGRPKRQPKKR